jgi:hypothetical protein
MQGKIVFHIYNTKKQVVRGLLTGLVKAGIISMKSHVYCHVNKWGAANDVNADDCHPCSSQFLVQSGADLASNFVEISGLQ